MADETFSPNDIAIVGMALRVPGAKDAAGFWKNLCDGVESISTLTPEELIQHGESAERMHHPNYVPRAAVLDEMELFDADFFGLSPKEAAIMDPQHRQFLECAWEAMEDAGRTPDTANGPVGVFAGCGMGSYFYFNVCSNRQLVEETGMFLLRHTGNDKDFLATRASFNFDLRGPSVNVQTACSTSLVAVHYACQSLLNGECDMALAGGVTIELPHRRGYVFQDGEILSPDGHCRAFDHRAAGTVFGSGTGVVVLRRLADAMEDGDVIHAVIKASALNNDGGTKAGYLAPSVSGQAEAIVEAQVLSGLPVETIGYVECHGTGTYLGDPIEIEALTQAFRQSTSQTGFCRIGSVKTNIGHLDTAAGVVGLIKAALIVKHGQIPPSLNYEKPNPSIAFETTPFIVNDRLTEWQDTGAPRRAAINSLGVGGTNAHVILEQPPVASTPKGRPASADNDNAQLLVFSAKSRKALDGAVARLAARLADDSNLSLRDTAYTLLHGRKAFEHRRVVAVRDRQDAIATLSDTETRRAFTHSAMDSTSGAVFLFPGGGAQHTGMTAQLYAQDTGFRALVDEGLSYLPAAAATEIRQAWLEASAGNEAAAQALLKPSVQLPAILIIEIAISRTLMAAGIRPSALIGHSMGENAAACLAGVFSFKDAVNLVRLRGELFDTIAPGGMLSVPMDPASLQAILPEALDLASVNAPQFCVVSGKNEDLEAFRADLLARDIESTRIQIDIAAHSRMLDDILPRFEAFLRSIRLSAPRIPIMSNLTGEWLSDAQAIDPTYWCRHLRSTVEFARGMGALAADKSRVYIEVGPSRALSSLAKAQGNIDANQIINALPHPDEVVDDRLYLLTAIGRAFAVGLPADLSAMFKDSGARRVSLPTYAFQHRRFFIEQAAATTAKAGEAAPLLRRADISDWGYRPVWKQSLPDIESEVAAERQFWLVFADEGGIGANLTERLRKAGHRVATVRLGDNFGKRGADDYVLCPENERAGYDALFSGLAADGEMPSQIVHLWLLTTDESHRPGSSFFHRNQECGFYSILYLSQAMADAGAGAPLHLTIATNGMQRVADEAVPCPEKATILGPALVLPKEMPGVTVRIADMDLPVKVAQKQTRSTLFARRRPEADEQLPDTEGQLWNELMAAPATETLAYRAEKRWKRAYAPLKLQETDKLAIRQRGVYMFTGGQGDLALALASQLVNDYQAKIVLVGRRPLPDRSQWPLLSKALNRRDRTRRTIAAISAMEETGAKVLYLNADVGNQVEMQAAVAEARKEFGELNGVFHTAGLVKDDLIPLKTHADVEEVFAPKVHGTAVLADSLDQEKLDLLVLFSSTSTDTAPAGQVDYVAANAYLNAYAESCRNRTDRKTVAVHWGVWDETGLAARAMGRSVVDSQTLEPASGPFFTHWVEDEDENLWLETSISPRTHWLLSEHRLVSGTAILPGTGYIELLLQAAREYGLAEAVEIRDLVFLRPLDVEDNAEKLVRLRLEPTRQGLRATITAQASDGAFVRHAEALLLQAATEQPRIDIAAVQARCTERTAAEPGQTLRAAQEDHVRFGPRWRVLKSLSLGKGEALAELELAEQAKGDDTRLHPALMDIATGCAMDLIAGYGDSKVLWAPASYAKLRVLAPLPQKTVSWLRLADAEGLGDGYAAFDVVLADEAGNVIAQVDHFIIKRLDDDVSFAAPAADTARAPSAAPRSTSPAVLALAAQVAQGIRPAEGFSALVRALGTGESQPIISSMDLPALISRANQPLEEVEKSSQLFERPALERDFVAPRNAIERKLADFWRELLGVDGIGVDDSFFDIGGHSLIAVRLFRMIRQEYGLDFPISVLFEAPTIAACAALIGEKVGTQDGEDGSTEPRQEDATSKLTHLVVMHKGKNPQATPFFLCAGMFGNILNLRHLALHLGTDRPVYGLQSRGLYGMESPHETFEEAAREIISEIRTVQPHGPYLLGGFSGGGITAFEIARQLQEAGETVSRLIMLDTPLPTQPALTQMDRLDMKLQDLKRNKLSFVSQWWRNRMLWEKERREKESAATSENSTEQFHNHNIEAAFRRALELYQVRPYAGTVHLFRPVPDVVYQLRDGRRLQEGRTIVLDDNGWTPFVDELVVAIVPGDHDGMVLEPCVRVLAERMRQVLNEAPVNTSQSVLMAAE
ncbi:SDR family NAD(P)-dependent oxidoreductase [Aureimonas fodinaquatilis]|uniref:Phenolphthiocerol/phthiocerol polyketide synthase subunit E n=1 Tax=Aureimonas fodinaquatilis TaxID=2565783 RepID=A0A5B0DUY6_9HYPH|nr:type I polyketide synthase [Aureimonas fodinaquatilis]KAA0970584.1 SDR family NAD(P)-dependent oxidoreductase [Aureimonas fodinaquatilis]